MNIYEYHSYFSKTQILEHAKLTAQNSKIVQLHNQLTILKMSSEGIFDYVVLKTDMSTTNPEGNTYRTMYIPSNVMKQDTRKALENYLFDLFQPNVEIIVDNWIKTGGYDIENEESDIFRIKLDNTFENNQSMSACLNVPNEFDLEYSELIEQGTMISDDQPTPTKQEFIRNITNILTNTALDTTILDRYDGGVGVISSYTKYKPFNGFDVRGDY